MITYKRCLLIINGIQLEYIQKFEAISVIAKSDTNTVMAVWGNNKTPAVWVEDFKQELLYEEVECVDISGENLLKDDSKESVDQFTDFCHTKGFECGEYITGQKVDTREEPCILCQIGNYKGLTTDLAKYNEFVPDLTDCIIYESRFFYVTSELGSLKPGFLMIVPKGHYYSVANFSEEVMREYRDVVCPDIENLLKGVYGDDKAVSFFEHGSSPSGFSSHKKSIVHAHTHVLADFSLSQYYRDMIKMTTCLDIREAKDTHYFSYQEGCCGQMFITMDDEVYVQRQFARQILAKELNLAPEQYNWRKIDRAVTEYNVVATLYNIFRFLTKCDIPDGTLKTYTKGFVDGYGNRI